MHTTGTFKDAQFDLTGNMLLTFEVDQESKAEAMNGLDAIKDRRLTIDAKQYRNKRSLDANAYAWKLFDQIAIKLRSDRWTIYLLQLSKYGVFVDVTVPLGAVDVLKQQFREMEVMDHDEEEAWCRCYIGSSNYNTEQMSNLIDGTVRDAKDLGIDTLTPDEQKALISAWENSNG